MVDELADALGEPAAVVNELADALGEPAGATGTAEAGRVATGWDGVETGAGIEGRGGGAGVEVA